ncbi:hypothetical protein VTK73DRAFT_1142 [Phialemonium thermophilum]|uniref:Uncharacterized protein n=1 Tax=Phialemonium thermophilum TaxID=223376 RepID=A0ABR3XBN6_9PEZI
MQELFCLAPSFLSSVFIFFPSTLTQTLATLTFPALTHSTSLSLTYTHTPLPILLALFHLRCTLFLSLPPSLSSPITSYISTVLSRHRPVTTIPTVRRYCEPPSPNQLPLPTVRYRPGFADKLSLVSSFTVATPPSTPPGKPSTCSLFNQLLGQASWDCFDLL